MNQFLVDLDDDGKHDLLMHNNLYFDFYYEVDEINNWGTMAEITDFPVPYFYDGEKLVYDQNKGKAYYEKILSILKDEKTKHSTVLSHRLYQILGKPSPFGDYYKYSRYR